MNTQLRELFDAAADSEVRFDLAERAVDSARTRRRQRFAVGGAVVATAAVVLGVVVANADLRSDADPRPTDVASIPSELPTWEGLPTLTAGAMESASAGYVVDGQLVLVDAESGEAMHVGVTPDPELGESPEPLIQVSNVALSPDGRRAVITVAPWPGDVSPTVRVLEIASASDTVLPDLTPADDAGGVTVTRPSVYAWENDSESFYCACAFGKQIPRVHVVTLDADDPSFSVPTELARVSPTEVVLGTAGAFGREGADGLWWILDPTPKLDPLEGYALAVDRESGSTYLEVHGWGTSLGTFTGEGEPVTSAFPNDLVESEFAVATDVDAVRGGFVVVMADAERGEGFQSPGEAITKLEAIYFGTDGSQRLLTTFPDGAFTASFASDVVGQPEPPTAEVPQASELPADLPSVANLPSLQEGDIDAAKVAFFADKGLAVIDAQSDDAFRIPFDDTSTLDFAWTDRLQLAMSPDGRYVMVSSGLTVESAGGEPLWLVDVATASVYEQDYSLVPVDADTPSVVRMAWSPDSQWFACLCQADGDAAAVELAQVASQNLSNGQPDELTELAGSPTQLSWGAGGLAVRFDVLDPNQPWRALGATPPFADVSNPEGLARLTELSSVFPDRVGQLALSTHSSDEYGAWASGGLGVGKGPGWIAYGPEAFSVDKGAVFSGNGGFLVTQVDPGSRTAVTGVWYQISDVDERLRKRAVTSVPPDVLAVAFAADQVSVSED